MDKSVFLYCWFSFDLYYLILGGTNNVLQTLFGQKKTTEFVHSVESGTNEKVFQ